MTKPVQTTLRLTPRRQIILEILRERGHLDAYGLLELARRKDPRISLATVYRALAYFRERNLIQGRSFGEGRSHFEVHDAGTGAHAHFVCTRCGKVREVKGKFIRDMEALAQRERFRVTGAHLDLFGLCGDCAAR